MSGEMVDCHNLGKEEGCYWSRGSDVNDSPQHPRMSRACFHSKEYPFKISVVFRL